MLIRLPAAFKLFCLSDFVDSDSLGSHLLFCFTILSSPFLLLAFLAFIFLHGAREEKLSPAVVEKLKDSAHQAPSCCPSSPHLTFKHSTLFYGLSPTVIRGTL